MSRKRQRLPEDEEALQHIRRYALPPPSVEEALQHLRIDRDALPDYHEPSPPLLVEEEPAVRTSKYRTTHMVDEHPAMEQPAVQSTRNVYHIRDIVAVFRTLQTSIPESELYVTSFLELIWQAHVVGNSTIHINVSFDSLQYGEFQQETEGIPMVHAYSRNVYPPPRFPPPSTTNRYFLWNEVMDILHDAFNPDDHYVRVHRGRHYNRPVPDSIEAFCNDTLIEKPLAWEHTADIWLDLYYVLEGILHKLSVLLLNPTECIDLWYPGVRDCETVCTQLLQPFLAPEPAYLLKGGCRTKRRGKGKGRRRKPTQQKRRRTRIKTRRW